MAETFPIEHTIIHGLLRDKEFCGIALQLIEPQHFKDEASKFVFERIQQASERVNFSVDEVKIIAKADSKNMPEETRLQVLEYLEPAGEVSTEFLMETTEQYCKQRGVMNALFESVDIHETGKNLDLIPDLLAKAISFSFNLDLALDYKADLDQRLDSYLNSASKIPFKLAMLNKITAGGTEKGTLCVFVAPTGFGKSILMADDALFQAEQGLNILYYTFEMSDFRFAKRMDANAFDMTMQEVERNRYELEEKFKAQASCLKGNIYLKEYAPDAMTASGLASHIKRLEQAKGVKIDIIYVDYINLLRSADSSSNAGTYKKIENVCKELIRHIAKAFKIPVISATQLQRNFQNKEADITGIAESQGLANTVDLLVSFYETPELQEMGIAKGKQLKNRFGDLNYFNTFMVALNRAKMRFEDCSEDLSKALLENTDLPEEDDIPIADKGTNMASIREQMKHSGPSFGF